MCQFVNILSSLSGVDFIHILQVHYLYKSAFGSFLLLRFSFVIFGTNASVNCWWNWQQSVTYYLIDPLYQKK
jgi:hypothetical protein